MRFLRAEKSSKIKGFRNRPGTVLRAFGTILRAFRDNSPRIWGQFSAPFSWRGVLSPVRIVDGESVAGHRETLDKAARLIMCK